MSENEKKEYDDLLTEYYRYQLEENEEESKENDKNSKELKDDNLNNKKNNNENIQTKENLQENEDKEMEPLELKDKDGNFLLSGILSLCVLFSYTSDEKYYKQIQEIENKIKVKNYLPLNEKTKLIIPIVAHASSVVDSEIVMAIGVEVGKIVFGLFSGYCINIVNDLEITSLQYDLIDLFYQSGFIDYLLQFCEKDYNRFCTLVDNSINFTRITSLLKAFSDFDIKNIDEFNKSIDALSSKFTPETLQLIKAMTKVGSDEIDKFIDQMNSAAVNKALNIDEDKVEKNKENEK